MLTYFKGILILFLYYEMFQYSACGKLFEDTIHMPTLVTRWLHLLSSIWTGDFTHLAAYGLKLNTIMVPTMPFMNPSEFLQNFSIKT
jgi:hypothetical protein